ncbi:type I methionyl aminopeptidase [Candidatus Nomurabacteria bacterium]|nr:type I methionyl aminopeptidase [Candidatus Nomurabacteria bacterium]
MKLDKKTSEEIKILQEGGHILALIRDQLAQMATLGVTGLELDAQAQKMIKEAGGKPSFLGYHGFPNALCVSINETVVHGIPNKQAFQEGDLVGLDIGMEYKGLYTDTATTVAIGKVSEKIQKLLEVTKNSLALGIDQAQVGNDIAQIGQAIEKYVRPFGFGIVKDLAGHGVGRAVHEEPFVPNYNPGQKIAKIPSGLVIAIEPMLILGGSDEVLTGSDNWAVNAADGTQTAHFEHTIAITEDGPLILTI